jgi:hypothetical protein
MLFLTASGMYTGDCSEGACFFIIHLNHRKRYKNTQKILKNIKARSTANTLQVVKSANPVLLKP